MTEPAMGERRRRRMERQAREAEVSGWLEDGGEQGDEVGDFGPDQPMMAFAGGASANGFEDPFDDLLAAEDSMLDIGQTAKTWPPRNKGTVVKRKSAVETTADLLAAKPITPPTGMYTDESIWTSPPGTLSSGSADTGQSPLVSRRRAAESQPTPVASEPAAVALEPTPAPAEPTPAPVEPTPAQAEPTPAPPEPTPAPAPASASASASASAEPTPAQAEPAPAPPGPISAPPEPTPAAPEPSPAPDDSPKRPLTRKQRLAERRRLTGETPELPPIPTRRQLRETGQLKVLPADDEPITTGEELPDVPMPTGVQGYRTVDPQTGELTPVLPVPGTEPSAADRLTPAPIPVVPVEAPAEHEPAAQPVEAPADLASAGEPVDAPVDLASAGEPVDAPVDLASAGEPVEAPADLASAGEPVDAPVAVSPEAESVDAPTEVEPAPDLEPTFSGPMALAGQVTRTPTGEFVKPVTGQFPAPMLRPTSGPQPIVKVEPDPTPREPRFFTPIQILILSIVIAALGILIGFAIAESRHAPTSTFSVDIVYSALTALTQGIR